MMMASTELSITLCLCAFASLRLGEMTDLDCLFVLVL